MIAFTVAALYFGHEVFVPLALATLLSFALAPPVRWLRRRRIPNGPAVFFVVTVAFLVIFSLAAVVGWQATDVAERLPTYRFNIEKKIDTIRESPPGGNLFERASDLVRDLGRKLDQNTKAPASPGGGASGDNAPQPIPVQVTSSPPSSMQIISTVIGPLVRPLATAGIVVVFVIFMLLKRDDLRDRAVRLVGARDLPRATQTLDDAAQRVGRYLLMQLVINTVYAVPIGVGLWLIGLPNPILWGLLCALLRFVPYIGPIVGAAFPLALAIAIDPGWTTFLLAGALFIVVEAITGNVLEPWLYGSSTGLSPLAVIAAAVFWTWLWGPIGLLLSTPLTVCLVVLGRHLPQLGFLEILLSDQPPLEPSELLYRQLLVGDPEEATEGAERYLADHPLATFYDDVAVPALLLAESDRVGLRLSEEQRERVAESAEVLVDNLAEWEAADDAAEAMPDLAGAPILCAGARGNLDEAAAAMLAQLLDRRGAETRLVGHASLQTIALREIEIGKPAAIVLSYLNPDSLAHARFLVRRLRRRVPDAHIVLGMWSFPPGEEERRNPLEATRADHFVTSLADAAATLASVLAPAAAAAAERARPPAEAPALRDSTPEAFIGPLEEPAT
jgi:predicted PurR-regulated permease PerM